MKTTDILRAVKESPGNRVKFAVTDTDGVLRGKAISKSKFLAAAEKGLRFCDVIFGWDVEDGIYETPGVTGWHTGYPDAPATIDLSTYRTIPWDHDTPFFLADFHESDRLSKVCPRTLLKNLCRECEDLGFRPMFAIEYEWYNFRETPQRLQEKEYRKPEPITPGMFGYSMLRASQESAFFNDLFDQLGRFGVPLEALHTETGDGVYEAGIEYTDALAAADRAALFKTGVKEIASRHEMTASFMAKWTGELPGSGGHVHQSLWSSDRKQNRFDGAENGKNMSSLMEYYLAGQLHCLPYILPMFAPVVNSYKRYVAGSWASTSVSWGEDNRTTALRVIAPGGDATRLETRVPGADANPYLALAACLASGLYGIRQKLPLEIPKTTGNEYEQSDRTPLPGSLKEAVEAMKTSELPARLFGDEFVRHFVQTREWEWEQFSRQVTDWELRRYFEII